MGEVTALSDVVVGSVETEALTMKLCAGVEVEVV